MNLKEHKFEYYIGTSPERVWELLISPEGTRQIFFNCVLESSFQIGQPLAYVGPGNDGDRTVHVYGDVLAYEPNKLLSFSEHPGPSYNDNHEALETRVTIRLEKVGNCTQLTLVNDLWQDDNPGYDKAAQSWASILSNLKTLAETGKTLDFGW